MTLYCWAYEPSQDVRKHLMKGRDTMWIETPLEFRLERRMLQRQTEYRILTIFKEINVFNLTEE